MTAHILVVEDDEGFIEELKKVFAGCGGPTMPTFVTNREDAVAKLESGFFDFAILDLKIPTSAGTTDFDPEHGKYVFHHLRRVSPGTKILVLTGSPSDDFIAPLLAHKHDADIWSEGGKVGTVEFLKKIEFDQAPDKIGRVVTAIHALAEIELHTNGLNLSTGEDRLVRIFAKHFKAVVCSVHPIGAGKSGARPLRLQMFDQTGAPIRDVVAKLGDLAKMQDEDARYEEHVTLLDGAATPRKMKLLEFGAGAMAGLFYQLANGHDASMFKAMAEEDALAGKAVAATAEALAGWSNGKNQERRSIASIRSQWVSNERAAELHAQYGLQWAAEFEGRMIQTRWCSVHGDLHGENILVSPEGGVLVIDYGDVGFGAAAYDPMTLELSAVLQANPTLGPDWPTADACRQWHDLEAYLMGCPIPEFIRACRAWSEKLMVGRRELAACAYSYLLRQLKYPDTDKDRILALLEGVLGCWGDS
ncbi:phosphotransferase [Sphingobium sp. LF-16]|uniref:phosphotransferase n=1 Tax=unclassified Sphingobium TaxID=2611147 RepID=UPI0019D0CFB3|nr:phosphotransferase [Sphingobium sp. LF-16]